MKNYNNYKKTFSELPEVEYAIEPDWELVLNILKVRRHSGSITEENFVQDLKAFFDEKGATTYRDTFGNLYVTKGEATQYRCLVAHTDINQAYRDDVRIYMNKDWIFGFDMEEGCQCGVGADDGIGISLAIEMFNRFDAIKLFFPLQEEIGCIGSGKCEVEFFSNCTMIVQGDRRSFTNDLITFTNGIEVCSQEFVDAASEISLKYGYAKANGICTDVGKIKANSAVTCVAMNISIGYAFEHSDKEVISKKHYQNAVNYVYDLLVGLGGVKWEHTYVAPVYKAPVPTSARQINIWEEDIYDDYYSSRYGQSYWENTSKDSQPKEARSSELSQKHSSFNIPVATDTNVEEETDIDVADEWYMEMYPQYVETEKRLELRHYKCDDVYISSALPNQGTIDDMILDGVCPCCRNEILPDNFLLITTSCNDCFSMFNIPPEDYDAMYGEEEKFGVI
jgi:hypothetical protein